MTLVPASGTFNAEDDLTQGELRQALEDVRNVIAEIAGAGDPLGDQALEIAGGVITPLAGRSRFIRVDVEGGVATSDDLDTIVQTNVSEGGILILSCEDNSRAINVQHLAGGVGQMSLNSGLDLQINQRTQFLVLKRSGNAYLELARWGREKEHVVGDAGEPAYAGAWGDATGGVNKPRFWKDENGVTRLTGGATIASVGAAASTIFTLPVGYRPVSGYYPVYAIVAGNAEINWISTGAGVINWNRASSPGAVAVTVDLSPVAFRAVA